MKYLFLMLGFLLVVPQAQATYDIPLPCDLYPEWELCQPPVVDVCPNIEGNQETVPAGYTLEGEVCVEIPPVVEEPPVVVPPVTPPVVIPPVSKEEGKTSLHNSQGPLGMLGDACGQFTWKTIGGSDEVKIKYSYSGAFGKDSKTLETKDDGSKTLCFKEGTLKVFAKIKGENSEKYSTPHWFSF